MPPEATLAVKKTSNFFSYKKPITEHQSFCDDLKSVIVVFNKTHKQGKAEESI